MEERIAEPIPEVIEPTFSRTPLDEIQGPPVAAQDKSGRSINVPDEKMRALLASILRELQKQTLILLNAFPVETRSLNLENEKDLEV